MTRIRLSDGREVDVDERKAKMLVRAEKATYVRVDAPEAAVPTTPENYARRHPRASAVR